MDEAEAIRAEKAAALRAQLQKQQELQAAQARLEAVLRRLLSPDAKARLANVRMANPALYARAVQALLAAAQAGQLQGKLSAADLKKLLVRLRGEKRDIRIRRR